MGRVCGSGNGVGSREGMGGEGVYEGGKSVWWKEEGKVYGGDGRGGMSQDLPGRLYNTYNLPLLKLYIKPNSELSPLVLIY